VTLTLRAQRLSYVTAYDLLRNLAVSHAACCSKKEAAAYLARFSLFFWAQQPCRVSLQISVKTSTRRLITEVDTFLMRPYAWYLCSSCH
jgi:hypothetical protein